MLEQKEPLNYDKLYQEAKDYTKSFCGFFINNHRFSILLILAIVIFGGMALFSLPRESEPEVEIPFGNITTIYAGAAPGDVEKLITDKLEDELKSLNDVKRITSNSNTGISSVAVEFSAEADLDESMRKLREAVDKAKSKLPNEAEDPIVSEVSFSDIPIITFSLQGDFSQTELNSYSKALQEELESIPYVSKVSRSGNLDRQFKVEINRQELEGLSLTVGTVIQAIASGNASLPLGSLEINNINYQLRLEGEIEDINALKNLPITTRSDGTVIYLSDIAEVKDGFEKQASLARLSQEGQKALPTVSLQIYKRTGGNILNIIKEAKSQVDELKGHQILPDNLQVIITNDNAQFVAEDLDRLGKNAITTVIIIFIILLFVLGWREALIAGLAIPLSFLSAFLFLKLQGQTLNSMVLFALVLALGLLVDNIIVILEGIYDNINNKKMRPFEGTLLAVKSFFWPVTSGTMTTVAAFLPMLLVSGIMGQYMGILPKTVSAVLISALFISVTLIPAIAAKILKKNVIKKNGNGNGQTEEIKAAAFTALRRKIRDHFLKGVKKIQTRHVNLLDKVLLNKKQRRKYIIVSWIIFVVMTSFPLLGLLKIEMFPKIDIDYFYVNIKTPLGSSLAVTDGVAKKVEDILYQTEDVDNFVTQIGSSASLNFTVGSSGGSANTANINVNLVDEKLRNRKSFEVAEELRRKFTAITEAEVKIEELTAGPPTGKPVDIRLTGYEIDALNRLADQVIADLKQIEGAVNIAKSVEDSTGEFVLYPKKEVLARYGLNNLSFASALRQTIYGIDASEVNLNNEDIKIYVALNEKNLIDLNDVENLLIATPSGQKVPISVLTEKKFEPNLAGISHLDGERIINVTADVEGKTAQEIFQAMQAKTDHYDLPSGYKITYGGEVEDIQQSFTEIFLSFIVSIILIAAILILQFNSFKQPLIIMSTLPLAMIGVFFGLTVLRLAFSLPAFIGIVGLAGIVVNDAIILIDKINKNIYTDRMALKPAIIEATQSRMQPIFLTTITTVAGILPLGLSDPLWAGLSFSIIFGLTFATFLTLVMVPITYVSLEGKRVAKFFNGEVKRN